MRTKVQQILVIVVSCFLLSFSISKRNYQTECVAIESNGFITIKIWDSKRGSRYKIEQARKDAIHAVLYSGIAGNRGCTTQYPILNNSKNQENFKKIEKDFFSRNGKWSTFTQSASVETTLPANLGSRNWKVYQVSVSKNNLRKFLEEQNIINTLTKGF